MLTLLFDKPRPEEQVLIDLLHGFLKIPDNNKNNIIIIKDNFVLHSLIAGIFGNRLRCPAEKEIRNQQKRKLLKK